ncbi:unnamed protein product [Cunninghamella echinulata]
MIHQLKIKYLALALFSIYSCVNGATLWSEKDYKGTSSEVSRGGCVALPSSFFSIEIAQGEQCSAYKDPFCLSPSNTYHASTPETNGDEISMNCY